MIFRSKRANVGLDAIMLIVVLFCVAIAGVIGYKVIKENADDMAADPDINPQANATMQQVKTQYPNLMDNGFIFILGLMWVLAIVASFFVDAHPIFLILAIVILIIVLFVGGTLQNVYSELSDEPDLSTEAAAFSKTNWVFDHLILTILAISGTILLALYGKNKFT